MRAVSAFCELVICLKDDENQRHFSCGQVRLFSYTHMLQSWAILIDKPPELTPVIGNLFLKQYLPVPVLGRLPVPGNTGTASGSEARLAGTGSGQCNQGHRSLIQLSNPLSSSSLMIPTLCLSCRLKSQDPTTS